MKLHKQSNTYSIIYRNSIAQALHAWPADFKLLVDSDALLVLIWQSGNDSVTEDRQCQWYVNMSKNRVYSLEVWIEPWNLPPDVKKRGGSSGFPASFCVFISVYF